MNNKKFMALAAAMLVGTAGAVGTTAGTSITNTATASFDNPAYNPNDPGSTEEIITKSNEVVTKVLPKPAFDIVYTDGTDGTVPGSAIDAAGTEPIPADYQATIADSGSVTETYVVQNTGNTTQTIQLTSATAAYNEQGDPISPTQEVTYYEDSNGDGVADGPAITEVTLAPDSTITILQVVEATGNPGDQFVTSPVGTGQVFNTETKAVEEVSETPEVLELQFSEVTIYTPEVDNKPDGGTPSEPTVTNPPQPPTDVTVPTGPVNPSNPTEPGNPGDPIVPTTPDGDPIVTVVNGDEQRQNVPYTEEPATAIFGNEITNNGTETDPITLTVTDPNTGQPANYEPSTGEFTFTDPTTGEPVNVTLYGPDGDPLTGGENGPIVEVPAGETVDYTTVVEHPATHNADGELVMTEPLEVKIGADSGLDNDSDPDDYTTDTLVPGDAEFGNDDGVTNNNADPAPTDPQTVVPGGTTQTPKNIANTGDYPDTYTVKGYTEITLNDGTTALVPVTYPELTQVTDEAGQPVTETLTVTKKDGTTATVEVPVYETPEVAPGEEAPVFNATVDVPANAASGTYTLKQTAEGEYSGEVMTDNNDEIIVSAVGKVNLAKFQAGAGAPTTVNDVTAPDGYGAGEGEALPGENIEYAILAKNEYNSPVANFKICDTVPANTNFVSVAGNGTGPFIYSTDNGATWDSTAPAAGDLSVGNEVCVARDADADNLPDALPASGAFHVDFEVTVQ